MISMTSLRRACWRGLLVVLLLNQRVARGDEAINRTPYISTYYIHPKVNVGEAAIIDYYVTDFDQKEYLDDDVSERFLVEYWVNGAKGAQANVPAGERSLNLGVLPKGKVLFALQATDAAGVKSHRLYQEFLIVDPADEVIQPGQILHPDLAAFNISSNDTAPAATTAGLTALLNWAGTNGYRKVVLPRGRYRIDESNTVQMVSGVTLDMNGSTFKLNPSALAQTMMLEFVDCVDSHVTNGIFEGDLLEHDFVNAPNNSEWVHAMSISQGSQYCSVADVVITNVTGYGTCTRHRHSYDYPVEIGNHFVPGDVDEQGALVASTVRTTNTNLIDVAKFVASHGFIQLGLYLGYQGNSAWHWVYRAHFYDTDKTFLESIEGYVYRRLYPPANARFVRFTLYSTSQPDNLCVFNFRSPYNCAYRSIRHVNIRCVGMALTGMNNMLVEDCRFDNCGFASAKCAFDAEDGWDLMQDLTFRNNVFGVNPANEFLTCAGHNFVVENNIMKAFIYDRTRGTVIRNNAIKSAEYRFGTRNRTGFPRISGNVNAGKVNLTLATTTPSKAHAVRDDTCLNGVSGPLGGWLGFRHCAITGGIMTARAVNCDIQSVTNTYGAFEIVDSVVSNSLLLKSQAVMASVSGSTVACSRLRSQSGGSIVLVSNHLIETACETISDWNTNHVFHLAGNRIETGLPNLLYAANSFRQFTLLGNSIRSTHPDFAAVQLYNPNIPAGSPPRSMLVDIRDNRFDASGGNAVKVNFLPSANCTLFANFHYNVYNGIALHTANIASKSNVIISILPDNPTNLAVKIAAQTVAENAGPVATVVTVSRYLNTAADLTVSLSSSDPTEATVPASALIPAGETAVTVALEAIDDDAEDGAQTAIITASAAGYGPGSASLTVYDNESAWINVTPVDRNLSVTEGETDDSYALVLGKQPAADVTVHATPESPLSVAPAGLVFTPANWATPQLVTVNVPDDAQAVGTLVRTITHLAASADPDYDGFPVGDVSVEIADNDLPALTVEIAADAVAETAGAAAATAVVTRNTPVDAALTVTLASSDTNELTVAETAEILAGQSSATVRLDAVDDYLADGGQTVTITAAAEGFLGGGDTLQVSDDDSVGVQLTLGGEVLEVAEGGTDDVYSMRLDTQPTAYVTITITPDSQLRTTPVAVTFTAADWNTPKTVTVGAIDDGVIEGPHAGLLRHAVTSDDTGYHALAVADATVIIVDNDASPIPITNAVPYAESFETFAAGLTLHPVHGWYADAPSAGTIAQMDYPYAGDRPLANNHEQVAVFTAAVTNRLAFPVNRLIWVDTMICPSLGDLATQPNAHGMGILYGADGLLKLWHRDRNADTNRWTSLAHPPLTSGTWARVTVAIDYETPDPMHPSLRYLRIFLNGCALTNTAGYTANDGSGTPGGHWFPILPHVYDHPSGVAFSDGACLLDDLVVTTQAPATADGTPWTWLAENGLTAADVASDGDRDGFTAGQEFIADTDPLDCESRFRIAAISNHPSATGVNVLSASGRLYTLERSSILSGPGSWAPLAEMSDVAGNGGPLWLRDTNAAPRGFYRVKVRLP